MNKKLNFFNTLSNKREKFVPMNNPSSKGYKKYQEIRKRNLHKMNPIPVCKMKDV